MRHPVFWDALGHMAVFTIIFGMCAFSVNETPVWFMFGFIVGMAAMFVVSVFAYDLAHGPATDDEPEELV